MPHPFVVGSRYRNRIGAYEVLQISGREMLIRYAATGQAVRTTVDIQARIWENMKSEENPCPPSAREGARIVTLRNLQLGIRAWLDGTDWDRDFHNAFYSELRQLKEAGGLSWDYIVQALSSWGALRPCSEYEILERGNPLVPELVEQWKAVLGAHDGCEPDLVVAQQPKLICLFDVAKRIKGVDSPVFASKLCHFLLPDAYPVIDNAQVGFEDDDYWTYWWRCAYGWQHCPDRDGMVAELRKAIGVEPVTQFPWSSKISELCHIGARHRPV